MELTIWKEGDTLRVPESYLVTEDRVIYRAKPDEPWVAHEGWLARRDRLQVLACIPDLLARDAHPRLGDVRDSVAYVYQGKDTLPDSLIMAIYERDANWRLYQRRVSVSSEPLPESLLAMPAEVKEAPPNYEDESPTAMPPLVEVAPGSGRERER